MDAQELQRLKELAQAAMGESDDDWYGPEFLRMQVNFSEDESKFVTATTPAAVLELIAMIESAVSPAESVQSVDTPAFRELLLKMYKRTSFSSEILNAEAKAVIAHADIKIAAARAEGRRSALEELAKSPAERLCPPMTEVQKTEAALSASRTLIKSLESQRDHFKRLHDAREKEYTEAVNTLASERQANSILTEELAKEKERADRAEADAARYDAMADEEIKNRDHYHKMADKLAQAIAEYFDADIGEHSSANCPWREALAVIKEAPPRKPLSSTAQPLQQFSVEEVEHICDAYESGIGHGLQRDGHSDGTVFANPDLGVAYVYGYREGESRAQPLQQEDERRLFKVGKETMVRRVMEHGMDLGTNPVAYEFRNTKTGHAIVDYSRHTHVGYLAEKDGYVARSLKYADDVSQPFDNLQQASTAQMDVWAHGINPAHVAAYDAALAAQAEPASKGWHMKMARTEEEYGNAPPTIGAARATPEGRQDLPRLPEAKETLVLLPGEPIESRKRFTADQMREYARAALAASQQAVEPVEQWRLKGAISWYDVGADDKAATLGTHNGYEKRTLYRAAPPQQVDTNGLPG
jgi:hypothetical protein